MADLVLEMEVIYEKIQKEQAKEIKSQFSEKDQNLKERLDNGKEITNKELRKLIKDYEKEERKESDQPEVLSETKYTVDSMAFKKDSLFWAEIRPIALTLDEIKGYKKADSLAVVDRKKEEGDSLKTSRHKGFQPWDILIGDNYKLSKTSTFIIHPPWSDFNTVEGFNLIYKIGLVKRWVERDSLDKSKRPHVRRLEITPIGRYAFSRKTLSGKLRVDYRTNKSRITVEGGRYVQQFNADEPIHPIVNTFTTLFLERNLIKLYERDFVEVNYRQTLNSKTTLTSNWSLSRRYELFNNSDFKLVKRDKESYTPNAPVNQLLIPTGFPDHNAFIGSVGIEARPWQKYRIRNGRKFRIENSSPLLTFDYKKGFNNVFNSQVDFDLVEVGVKHSIRMGIRGRLDVAVIACLIITFTAPEISM